MYEQALCLELDTRGIKAERQREFKVGYLGQRVGSYRVDLLVDEKIVVELKVAPKILPLHRAQVISYLKGFDKPLGILANFGGSRVEHLTFPKQAQLETALTDRFDYDKVQLADKARIRELLFMANRILITLGPGYLAQIYRRAFYHELKTAGCDFELVKEVTANYRQQRLGKREVNFFVIGDLLLSVVAVQELDDTTIHRFWSDIKHVGCRRGLIVNFHATVLDFRYLTV
ncbi:MAG: GxxExxY protein [bacterium]|nr:GxxExxY protein [bacterium]